MNWGPTNLSELTPVISNTGLTHLDWEVSNYEIDIQEKKYLVLDVTLLNLKLILTQNDGSPIYRASDDFNVII